MPVVPRAAAAGTTGIAVADLIAPGIRGLRPGTRCIFPLCVGEQPVGLASHFGEPFDVTLGVDPRNVDHRLPTAPKAVVIDTRVAAAIGSTGIPIIECHLKL